MEQFKTFINSVKVRIEPIRKFIEKDTEFTVLSPRSSKQEDIENEIVRCTNYKIKIGTYLKEIRIIEAMLKELKNSTGTNTPAGNSITKEINLHLSYLKSMEEALLNIDSNYYVALNFYEASSRW